METFKCWLFDDGDRDDTTDVDRFYADDAAEEFVKTLHDDGYFSGGFGENRSIEVGVIAPNGVETRWTVTAEFRPLFNASKSKQAQSPPGKSPSTK